MVLNNDVKMINPLLPYCIYIYGPGYDESYLMVAIIKIRLMLHLQSFTYLEHFLKFEVIIFETDNYMDVRNNMCNLVWNVTSRMALTM